MKGGESLAHNPGEELQFKLSREGAAGEVGIESERNGAVRVKVRENYKQE